MLRTLIGVAFLAVVLTGTASPSTVPPCTGGDLSGSFRVVPGSAGAGNIVYKLRVTNVSQHMCFVTGIPQLKLLDGHKRSLPTHARAEFPGALSAVMVTLAPGRTSSLTARFSPDVQGVGEQHPGQCEATAHWLRVTPSGGGIAVVPISPPTPVCEHGGMSLTVFTRP
jgi:Protein of unknown function (DUF4232)